MNIHSDSTAVTAADLVRQQLEAAGLSQRAAARELGIDERLMRRYCAGELAPPLLVTLGLSRLATIALNNRCLDMIRGGQMSASDGEATTRRFLENNRKLREANAHLLRRADHAIGDAFKPLDAFVLERRFPGDTLGARGVTAKIVDNGRRLQIEMGGNPSEALTLTEASELLAWMLGAMEE